MFDFEHQRAIVVDGHDFVMTFTSVHDFAAVVAGAVDYEGEWPVIGGIRGNSVNLSENLGIGEKIRDVSCRCLQQKAFYSQKV